MSTLCRRRTDVRSSGFMKYIWSCIMIFFYLCDSKSPSLLRHAIGLLIIEYKVAQDHLAIRDLTCVFLTWLRYCHQWRVVNIQIYGCSSSDYHQILGVFSLLINQRAGWCCGNAWTCIRQIARSFSARLLANLRVSPGEFWKSTLFTTVIHRCLSPASLIHCIPSHTISLNIDLYYSSIYA